jgi:microcystin-dependent protein
MGVATGFTAERMLAIENSSIVGGFVDTNGHLLLKAKDNSQIDAGNVVGPITTGIVNMYAGAVAPAGWLLCDGTAISRTTYAALFAVIGTTYGAGDGSTTFNVPNLKGRVGVGVDTAQTEFAARGQTGGEKAHTLSITEMPSHTHVQNAHGHTITDPGHNHTQNSHGHGITDLGHNHTQNAHSHTQDAHNHTQNSHGHTQSSHLHNPATLDGFQVYRGGAATRNRFTSTTSTSGFYAISSTTISDIDYAGNTDSQTPAIQSSTATNQSATATNQSTTATNNASGTGITVNGTTATNNSSTTGITESSTTATNQNTGGGGAHNVLQPYMAMNYIIHT